VMAHSAGIQDRDGAKPVSLNLSEFVDGCS
jgi:hypothetical protein